MLNGLADEIPVSGERIGKRGAVTPADSHGGSFGSGISISFTALCRVLATSWADGLDGPGGSMRGQCGDGIILLALTEERPGPPSLGQQARAPAGHHHLDRKDVPPPEAAKTTGKTHAYRIRNDQPDRTHSGLKPRVNKSRGRPDANEVYVGESLSVSNRMRQHLKSEAKAGMQKLQVIIDETFNKSTCLDLESFLIRLLAGDGRYQVLNGNGGVSNSDYYNREEYNASFNQIFDELRVQGLFERSIPQIENSDLFKFSPFKALNADQAAAVSDILDGLLSAIESGISSTIVVQGDPGTGKTLVAILLMKLLRDVNASRDLEIQNSDSIFSDYFQEGK